MSKILLFIALVLAELGVHAQAELHDDTLLIEGEVQRTVLGKKNIDGKIVFFNEDGTIQKILSYKDGEPIKTIY